MEQRFTACSNIDSSFWAHSKMIIANSKSSKPTVKDRTTIAN